MTALTDPGLSNGELAILDALLEAVDDGIRTGDATTVLRWASRVHGKPEFATARQKIQEQLVDGADEAIAYFRSREA